ncbi:hypothetical protein [Chamaesiphon sp. GL140_3_metabinner_50]|uniref:hypothetical protein n=1 Tax=Chamaesiphon sp. GL140_3_metabinner_50 TaxID=2970812 RepID=UPI0025D09E7C|nr:hypothetical protein [Chamaesiphon sp. GL140_3_metabinner_50]
MTSPDFQLSSADASAVATAFAVERQVLTPELSQSIADKEKIAAGLLLWLSLAIGCTIANVYIESIDRIYPPGRNGGLIDFKVVCLVPDRSQIHLGICILPFTDPELVSEACTRLLVYKDFGLDRLCLLRQADLMTDVRLLPLCLPKLLSPDIGGHFIPLKSKDLLTVLAMLSVFKHKHQHELTTQMIRTYILQTEPPSKSGLIHNILTTAQY